MRSRHDPPPEVKDAPQIAWQQHLEERLAEERHFILDIVAEALAETKQFSQDVLTQVIVEQQRRAAEELMVARAEWNKDLRVLSAKLDELRAALRDLERVTGD